MPVPVCLVEQHLAAFVKDLDVGLAVPAAVELRLLALADSPCCFRVYTAKDPYCRWQSIEVGFYNTKGSVMSDKREEVERAAALSFQSILEAISKSSERAEALAVENRERAEALSLAQDERMYTHVASVREDVLRHVSQDIEAVATELCGETAEAVASLRSEAEASNALIHR